MSISPSKDNWNKSSVLPGVTSLTHFPETLPHRVTTLYATRSFMNFCYQHGYWNYSRICFKATLKLQTPHLVAVNILCSCEFDQNDRFVLFNHLTLPSHALHSWLNAYAIQYMLMMFNTGLMIWVSVMLSYSLRLSPLPHGLIHQ